MQNDVLAADPLARTPLEDNLDRRRHAEPRLARAHARGHVRRPNARRERPERAVRAGVAVRADHQIARRDKPLLGQKRVLDAAVVPDLEVVDDALLPREGPHARALRRGLDVLVRREVVRDEGDLRLVEDLLLAELRERADRHGRRDVVAEHEVELRHDELARVDFVSSGVRREDLLCHCHCHKEPLLTYPCARRRACPPRRSAARSTPRRRPDVPTGPPACG